MRSLVPLLLLSMIPFAAPSALPKVAVLDALVSAQIDASVVGPVTEKVVERLVASGDFLVLDRANVEAVLTEREFQFSGMVSDLEVSQAGRYLGAEFVVVIRVETIGDTYFISSRMISVETGIIARQASAEGQGKLAVLLDLAGRVGASLAGKAVQPAPAAAQAPPVQPAPAVSGAAIDRRATMQTAPAAAAPPAAQPAQPAPRPEPVPAVPAQTAQPSASQPAERQTATITAPSGGLGGKIFLGGSSGTHEYGGTIYDTTGFDVYMLVPLGSPLGVSMSLSFADGSAAGGIMSNNFDLGLALVLPVGPIMPWASAKVGYAFLDSSDHTGFEYGWDAGIDLRLGFFVVGARYQVQYTAYESSTLAPFDAVTSAVVVMVGVGL